MKHWRPSWFFLMALALGTIPEAVAQEGPTSHNHRRYGQVSPAGDLEKILQDNLDRVKGLENLRSMLDRLGEHQDLFKNSKLGKLLNQDMLDRLNREGADFLDKDEQTKKAIGDFLKDKNFDEVKKQIPNFDKQFDQKKIDQFKKLMQPNPKPIGGMLGNPGGMKPPPNGPQNPPPVPNPPRPNLDSDEDFIKTVRNWLERAEGWGEVGEMLRESPTIQRAIDDLAVSFLNNDGSGWEAGNWTNRFGDLTDYADKGFSLFGDGFSALENFPTPSLPNISMPSVGSLPSFRLPSFGSPGPVGGGFAIGHVLVWVGTIVTLVLVFWQLWQRYAHPPGNQEGGPSWRLGAWPVNPAQVATRAELIQAFEFLSLLLLGPAARTWNHRDIAVSMGGEAKPASAPQRAAADRLADLYEEARYTPGDAPLPPVALEDARRNLCLLAGVAAP